VDTVADNASSGCFVLGQVPTSVHNVNLGTVGAVMRINGNVVETGAGAAVVGHPAVAVAWLANKLREFDTTLKKGDVVLSGAVRGRLSRRPRLRFLRETRPRRSDSEALREGTPWQN
jgi:2-keto-4-pentenoate hydratase